MELASDEATKVQISYIDIVILRNFGHSSSRNGTDASKDADDLGSTHIDD